MLQGVAGCLLHGMGNCQAFARPLLWEEPARFWWRVKVAIGASEAELQLPTLALGCHTHRAEQKRSSSGSNSGNTSETIQAERALIPSATLAVSLLTQPEQKYVMRVR